MNNIVVTSEFIRSIIHKRYKICRINLLFSIVLLAVVVGLDLNNSFILMAVYGIFTLLINVLLLLNELRFPGISLLIIFFVASFLRLTIPTLTMALDANDGIKFAYYEDYTSYIFQTTICMNIFYMFFVIMISHFSKGDILSFNLDRLLSKVNIPLFISILYPIGFVARLFPELISFSDTLRSYVSQVPQICVFIMVYDCAYHYTKTKNRILITLLMFEIFYATFFGFFKGMITINGVYYVMYMYLRARNEGKSVFSRKFITTIVMFILFVVFFIYPFMQMKRDISGWDPTTNEYRSYSNLVILESVFSGEAFDQYVKNTFSDNNRRNAVSDRQNSVNFNAYFYMVAQKHGYKTDLLETSVRRMVPQFISGKKNTENAGYLAASYVDTGSFHNKTNWYTYIGHFASSYLWGGWIAAIIMCIINAFFISYALRYATSNSYNLFSILLLMSLVLSTATCFEEIHDGGYTRNIMLLSMVIVINLTNHIFGLKRKRSNI